MTVYLSLKQKKYNELWNVYISLTSFSQIHTHNTKQKASPKDETQSALYRWGALEHLVSALVDVVDETQSALYPWGALEHLVSEEH